MLLIRSRLSLPWTEDGNIFAFFTPLSFSGVLISLEADSQAGACTGLTFPWNDTTREENNMATTIFRFKTSLLTASTLAFVLTLTLLVPAARASAPFLSNDEVQGLTGKSIAQWGAEWWQWAFENPQVLADRTGKSGRSAT
jgi:hypothetical protein